MTYAWVFICGDYKNCINYYLFIWANVFGIFNILLEEFVMFFLKNLFNVLLEEFVVNG